MKNLSLYFFLIITIILYNRRVYSENEDECKAWVVQSIPTDMPNLSPVSGVLSTADVFRWLAGNSSRSLDIMSQNWQLIAHPQDPRSYDYGYSEDDMQRFGSNQGFKVYQELQNAADRNIKIRLLQHYGAYPYYTEEPSNLASGRPNVKNATLLMSDWWGTGVVHAKIWVSDRRDVYIGSANNDWKALTQVKELGIYLVDCPIIAEEVVTYYDNVWKLAHLNSSSYTRIAEDQQWQITRKLPCWSRFLSPEERCRSPLPKYLEINHVPGYPVLSDPNVFHMDIQTPGLNYSTSEPRFSYLSFAPPELLFSGYQTDEQAWVATIKSVGPKATLRISTMNWLGQSQHMSGLAYWSAISSAISEVVFSKNAEVKLLVAWINFGNNEEEYLKSLLYTNILCSSSKYNSCSGKVEIKYYFVPGFNLTGPALLNGTVSGSVYPGLSRYYQGKYAVSDIRAHIGTSNLIWDHFYSNAGLSFGTYNPEIVSKLVEIFDGDWNSPYAVPFEKWTEEGNNNIYTS